MQWTLPKALATPEPVGLHHRSLRAYARWIMDFGWRPRLSLMRSEERWAEIVLHRDGCWQTELAVIRPGVVVPRHRHHTVESLDCVVGGSGSLTILPHCENLTISDLDVLPGPILHCLLRVPKAAWHGGRTFEYGAAFLSFQRWDTDARLITQDWEAWRSPEDR